MAKLEQPPEQQSFSDSASAFKVLINNAEYQSRQAYEQTKVLKGMNTAVQLVGFVAFLTLVGACLLALAPRLINIP
jgi:hypothetical protein